MEIPIDEFERLGQEIKRLEGLVEARDAEIGRLNRGWDESLKHHERLLSDIDRWNATIALGAEKAKLMEAVILAARELTIIQNEGYTKLVSRLIRLTDALEAYDANPVALPAPFSQI